MVCFRLLHFGNRKVYPHFQDGTWSTNITYPFNRVDILSDGVLLVTEIGLDEYS